MWSLQGLDAKHAVQLLTLTELEAAASLGTTRLLALHGTAVAGEESSVLELFLVLCVDFHQGAGDGQAQGLALAGEAATVEVGLDVVLLGDVEELQRLLDDILQDGGGEEILDVFLVDCYLAGSLAEVNARNGALATAKCINYFHLSLLFILVNVD